MRGDGVGDGSMSSDGARGRAVEAERRRLCDLMRVSEPGDRLLYAAIGELGVERTRSLIDATGPEPLGALRDAAEGAGLAADTAQLSQALERWRSRRAELDGARDLRVMSRLGARLVTPEDPEWPEGVDELGLDGPLGLWVRGPAGLADVLESSVALVGARAADAYGIHLARSFAWDLVAAGHTVVSGGAFGIDAAAHSAALQASESGSVGTVAFMAGGVDRFYPRANADLLGEVAASYAVVSEAAPGSTPMRHRFLMRNRLIAAAATATVVVQAGWRSGAINTANRAAELNRPVGAVPGPVTTAENAGCHRLIRDGAAMLVTTAAEVVELVGPLEVASEPEAQGTLRITDPMTDDELRVYGALPQRRGAEAAAIAVRAGLDMPAVMAALAVLELAGAAERGANGWMKARAGAGER